ncbi:MAG TPA: hypothetical protein VLR89_07545 [Anaerolineaceae bacterium]|nr:hypothetical protein [Anaerolineaceae bacterium]
METEKRSNLYLLTGLIFGLAIGLVISLMISPAINRDAAPSQLSENDKAAYRLVVAQTYVSDYNLLRAQSRLMLLGDPSPSVALAAQIQDLQGPNANGDLEALQRLMDALNANVQAPAQEPNFTPPAP